MADKDGRAERAVDVATSTALWSAHGKTMPVRWVLTRDPTGRAETHVFVCSDPKQSALQILTWYAMRWAVEPTFQEARRHLGFETQRQWSDRAIHRTTPLLLGLFSLVTLWATDQAARTGKLAVLGAAWYHKPDGCLVPQAGRDVRRLPRRCQADAVGGGGGEPDPVAG
jgi:hypothetical protein